MPRWASSRPSSGSRLSLEAVVLSRDESKAHSKASGPVSEPEAVGDQVAEELLSQGAGPLVVAALSP